MGKEGKIYGRLTEAPLPTMSLGRWLLDKLRENRNRVLLINGHTGKYITYREILEKSMKLANFLQQKRGVKIGDRISIVTENRLDWLVPACATLYLGAILVPYNPVYTEWELQSLLNISKPRIIFVCQHTEKIFAKMVQSLSWPTELIGMDDNSSIANIPTLKDILNNEKTVDIFKYRETDIGDNSKCPAVILCSSGTTGLPKGVTLSHRNIIMFAQNMCNPKYGNVSSSDKFILFLPFYHGFAFGILMMSIFKGCTIVSMSSFDLELFLNLVEKYKITYLPTVPSVLTLLAKHPRVERYDFSSVRQIICGAAPLSKDIISEIKTRLGVSCILNGYGMTEVSLVSNISNPEEEDINKLSYIMPNFLSKVVDIETGETLDAVKAGEICFKSVQVMLGYWNNPEATKQTIDKDGWLHTGDVGYYDERGRLQIIDRLKELIKYKGYQVSPTEIETVLLSHPAVKETVVVGKPDESTGEKPMAFVVKQPDVNITAQDLIEFVKQKLSPQKWLRGGVKFIETIPKTSTGKILRREIRGMISKL